VGLPGGASSPAHAEALRSPAFATGVGLVLCGAERERGAYDDLWDGVRERFGRLRKGLAETRVWGLVSRRAADQGLDT
jgi:hypothetical protein